MSSPVPMPAGNHPSLPRHGRLARALSSCWLLLPLFAAAAIPPPAPLVIAVGDPLAKENACACLAGHAQRDYRVLADLITRELHRPTELVFCDSLQGAHNRNGRSPDCFIGKVSAAVTPPNGTNPPPRCLAMLTGPAGETTLQGFFIVRRADPAQAVPDLAGRRILFGPPDAREKYGAALELMRDFGMTPPRDLPVADTCTAAALAVTRGEADAAVISDYAWPLLSACGAVDSSTLRVVGRTAPVPFIGLFATTPLSPADEASILRALQRISRSRNLRTKLETRDGFVAAPDAPTAPIPAASLPASFPSTPRVPWRYSMGAQSLGGLATVGNRVIVSDKTETLDADAWHCLDANTGARLWTVTIPAAAKMEYTSAPRATPVIDGDRVFLLGAVGDLASVELATGRIQWRLNLVSRFGGTVPQWGFCGTPLVLGGRVIVQTGSKKAGLVALNRLTGRELWRSPGSLPSYGSLIAAHLGGRFQIVGHDSDSLGGWDPDTGRRLWRLSPPNPGDFNVPTPVKVGDMLLIATENNGTRLYVFNPDGTVRPEPWAATSALSPDISTPVVLDGLVWGADSSGIHALRVADKLKTVWQSADSEYTQYMSLTAGQGRILAASLTGQLHYFTSPPEGLIQHLAIFKPDGDFPPESWSHPALLGSRLFWRSVRETVCIDLTTPSGP